MALIDYRILQGGSPSLVGAGLEGYDQGMQANDARRKRQADMEAQQKQQGFERTLRGLVQINNPQTPEGRQGLVRDLSKLGFAKEALGLMGTFQDQFPQAKPVQPEYQFKEFGDQAVTFDPNSGRAAPIPGMAKAPKGPTPYEIEKDKWERNYKERQLRQSGSNTAKDNELAASKFELAKTKTEADMARKAVDIPEMEAKADMAVSLIDQMIGSEDGKTKQHPGFTSAVGSRLSFSTLGGLKPNPIGGTDAADFQALYEQVKGGAFMEAVQSMKGLGTLTETEGRAATAAISRMNASQSETEFIKAAKEFRTAVKNRKGRAIAKAAGAPGQPVPASKLTKNPDGSFDYNPGN